MNLQDLLETEIIAKIVPAEKPRYLRFFGYTYKDNLSHANDNLIKYPRWSIILKKRLIELLEKAEITYRRVRLASILSMARDERENIQYYTGKDAEKETLNFKAAEFLEKIVLPFIKIMEGLI